MRADGYGTAMRRGVREFLSDVCGVTAITPYARCDYRCAYCISGVQGASQPMMTADQAVAKLHAYLDELAPRKPFICLGGIADAYPSVERRFELTRAIVTELVESDVPFTIVTKGDIILRDLDLLAPRPDLAYVQVSISSLDDDALRSFERHAVSGTVRFGVIDELHRAGVPVGLNLLPWIPAVSETEAIIDRVPEDVEVVLSPLSFGLDSDEWRLGGRTYRREEVQAEYMDEYRRLGHRANTSWIKPSPPPEENNPFVRLPVLEKPLAHV